MKHTSSSVLVIIITAFECNTQFICTKVLCTQLSWHIILTLIYYICTCFNVFLSPISYLHILSRIFHVVNLSFYIMCHLKVIITSTKVATEQAERLVAEECVSNSSGAGTTLGGNNQSSEGSSFNDLSKSEKLIIFSRGDTSSSWGNYLNLRRNKKYCCTEY